MTSVPALDPKLVQVAYDTVNDPEFMTDMAFIEQFTVIDQDSPEMLERGNDQGWLSVNMYSNTYTGQDQTGNFKQKTRLSIPWKMFDPIVFTAQYDRMGDARDPTKMQETLRSGLRQLMADINSKAIETIQTWSTNTVKIGTAPTGFADLAEATTRCDRYGWDSNDRVCLIETGTYQNMAADLAKRTLMPTSEAALRRGYLGNLSAFETYRSKRTNLLTAAGFSAASVNGANQKLIPQGSSVNATGVATPVDNRVMTLNVNVTGAAKVGDRFTIAGVFGTDLSNRTNPQSNSFLKTFTIVALNSPTSWVISPPIINGTTEAEKQYVNVTAVPANGAVITRQNTADSFPSYFFNPKSLIMIPGKMSPLFNGGKTQTGVQSYSPVTPINAGKLTFYLTQQSDINTQTDNLRIDCRFSMVVSNPEYCGALLFNQP